MTAAIVDKAHKLVEAGFMPVPLHGKVPVLKEWQSVEGVTLAMVDSWAAEGKLENIGLRTGDKGLVVLDFDGKEGWWAFMQAFAELADTYTVATGGGDGMHVYYEIDGELPKSTAQLKVPGGHVEIKAKGRQVVIPPSIHPDTGQLYTVFNKRTARRLSTFELIQTWIDSFNQRDEPPPSEYNMREVAAQSGTSYAKAALSNMVAELAALTSTENDFQNNTLNLIAWKLAHFVSRGDLTQMEVKSACEGAMRANGYVMAYGQHAFDATFDSGFQRGMADTGYVPKVYQNGHSAPRRELPGQRAYEPPKLVQQSNDIALIGRTRLVRRASLFENLRRRLNDDDYVPKTPPIIFPLDCLHFLGGQARVTAVGKLIGVVGASGSGKTSALETIADAYVSANVPVWMWTPEWSPDEMAERCMQRYGGPTQDELYLHEIDKWRSNQLGQPSNTAHRLTPEQRQRGGAALEKTEKWTSDVVFLENSLMTVGEMAEVMAAAQSMTPYPRVLIVDYAQLLKANEADSDEMSMYNMLQRFKALCVYYGLVGAIATQTTKDEARQNVKAGAFKGTSVINCSKNSRGKKGKVRVYADMEHLRLGGAHINQQFSADDHTLGSQAARFVNDDAFNLFLTLNPEYESEA